MSDLNSFFQQPMYCHPQYNIPPSTMDLQRPAQQQQGLTSRPLILYQQNWPAISQKSCFQLPVMTNNSCVQMGFDSGIPKDLDTTVLRAYPTNSNSETIASPLLQENGLRSTLESTQAVEIYAAPGPIPAPASLDVHRDDDGVSWVTFEYSRDRVRLAYTIRCDVESIYTDNLSTDFKLTNCIYPRAYIDKDNYRSNRRQYEYECNQISWALAELNPCLRGKRGLLQRAVDSWRNSHKDLRVRSRRVRKMNKTSIRKTAGKGQLHSSN